MFKHFVLHPHSSVYPFVLNPMASFAPRDAGFSASKSRRMRAAATKQRLYVATQPEQAMMSVLSQLAILTSTVDGLCHYIASFVTHAGHAECTGLSESGAAFSPPGLSQEELDVLREEAGPPLFSTSGHLAGAEDSVSVRAPVCTPPDIPTKDDVNLTQPAASQAAASSSPNQDRDGVLWEILQHLTVEKIDFYPKEQILRVQAQGREPFETLVDGESLADIQKIIRSRGITNKFCSHLHESVMNIRDDDWDFLQKMLEPCLEEMRTTFREAYDKVLSSRPLGSSRSSTPCRESHRQDTVQNLLSEAMTAIATSFRSGPAVQMFTRYKARIQVSLQCCIEDVFLTIDRETPPGSSK